MNDNVLAQLRRDDWKWRADFITELRALGVPGSAIGTALNETDQFCQDSGEWHLQAFGDPAEYARGLGLARTDNGLRRAIVDALPLTLQILGFWLVFPSTLSLFVPGTFVLQWVWVVIPALYFGATLINSDYFKQKRLTAARRWLRASGIVLALAILAGVFVQISLGAVGEIRTPAWLALALGLALVLGGSIWAQLGLAPVEPVHSPHDAPGQVLSAERSTRWQTGFRNWGFAAASLAFVIFSAVTTWR